MSIDQALTRLLAGTGLTAVRTGGQTYSVIPLPEQGERKVAAKSSPANLPPADVSSAVVGDAAEADIIVTAQKRSERLQDVPLPVTVVDTKELAATNQLRVQDYFTKIPGLSYQAGGLAGQESQAIIVIRGITTGGVGNAVVGTVIDDVPFGASASPTFAAVVPDIDPGDLGQIEVLRGPQGTLYGASSMGGLLKFVTVDPSPSSVSGRLQLGLNTVRSGGWGKSIRGDLNVPLTGNLAVRGSGFRVQDPGYIDNPLTRVRDLNERNGKGGRLAMLWQPSDDFSIRLSALIQDSQTEGADVANAAISTRNDLQLSGIPGVNIYHQKIQSYSAIASGKVGDVELKSITGLSYLNVGSKVDYTAPFAGGFFSSLATAYFGVTGVVVPDVTSARRFSQEVRASAPLHLLGQESTWLLGVMYNDEKIKDAGDFQAVNASTGAFVGTLLTNSLPSTYKEVAVFSNLDLQFTDRFDIQFGGRLSHIKQEGASVLRRGPLVRVFFDPTKNVIQTPSLSAKDDPFTYLISPRYKLGRDAMVYARVASGYRPGGPNANCGVIGVPCQYGHDTTVNYEVGAKAKILDRALSFDLSVYRIDWNDIQLGLTVPATVLQYTANAGTARSQGVELALEAHPLSGTTLAGWVAYNDAKLVKALPSTAGGLASLPAGTRLPMSSRWSGNASLTQRFSLAKDIDGHFGGSVSYVGNRAGGLALAPILYPSYVQADLSAGLGYKAVRLDVYVNNVTDKRASLSGDPVTSTLIVYSRPRTVGMTITANF